MWNHKNPLHLDVVDWFLWPMGDNVIPSQAPPSLELFYLPYVADIDQGVEDSMSRSLVKTLWYQLVTVCLKVLIQIRKCRIVAPYIMVMPQCLFLEQNYVSHPPITSVYKYTKHDCAGDALRLLGAIVSLPSVFICGEYVHINPD